MLDAAVDAPDMALEVGPGDGLPSGDQILGLAARDLRGRERENPNGLYSSVNFEILSSQGPDPQPEI